MSDTPFEFPEVAIVVTHIVALPDDTDPEAFDLQAWVDARIEGGEQIIEAYLIGTVAIGFDDLADLEAAFEADDADGGE